MTIELDPGAVATVAESDAVTTAGNQDATSNMSAVAASLVTLTTGNESGQVVWAVESKPPAGVIDPVPGGARHETGPQSGPGTQMLLRFDFIDAATGHWVQALTINGPIPPGS